MNNPAWDILLLLFFFSAVFIYGLFAGRNKTIVLLLASYPAVLLNEYLPYPAGFLSRFNASQLIFIKSFSFFVLALFIFWILSKTGLSRKEINRKTGQVVFLSFLSAGFWANIIFDYALKVDSEIIKLTPLTQFLFGSNLAHFIWLALPLLALFYIERK